jgi:hypothetical protein
MALEPAGRCFTRRFFLTTARLAAAAFATEQPTLQQCQTPAIKCAIQNQITWWGLIVGL